MRWKDVTDVHDGLQVEVSAKSTPKHPLRGEGPFIGFIECKKPDAVPILHVGNMLHHFAWWWDVKIIGDPTSY